MLGKYLCYDSALIALIFISEKELITPPLNGLILPGITRLSILELAREWNEFKVNERTFNMNDVKIWLQEKRVCSQIIFYNHFSVDLRITSCKE